MIQLHCGDCLEIMRTLRDDGVRVDAVVTDPPAGISFMGKCWDGDKGGRSQWIHWMQEAATLALELARPGAHALVWALPRTSHWTATAWEDAGWEVRDRVAHLFGTGFPKSMSVDKAIDKAAGAEREVVGNTAEFSGRTVGKGTSAGFHGDIVSGHCRDITAPATAAAKQWAGWGTALKPACEDWWLLRKPLSEQNIAANVLEHGTGALNIGQCRVPAAAGDYDHAGNALGKRDDETSWRFEKRQVEPNPAGRFPSNCIHDGSDEVLEAFAAFGERKSGDPGIRRKAHDTHSMSGRLARTGETETGYGDTGTAARFFYSAKASRQDRAGSKHPTVKPVSLMRYLCRLVTPPGGLILDPFAGSGTTLEAAALEGFGAIGIEIDPAYAADIRCRMQATRARLGLFAPALAAE